MLSWVLAHPPDLSWLGKPGRHTFRWRDETGRWRTSARRVTTSERLLAELARHPPRDVYVGTSAWLEPVRLPRLRDAGPPGILLDHLVVFDIDRPPFSRERLETARRDTVALVEWLARETQLALVHVAFSGSKGFHVVLRDLHRAPFREPDPRARERRVREARAALLARARSAGHDVDPTVTADTRRILRLPGTLHGTTGWACSVVPPATLRRPLDEWVDALPRREDAVPLPQHAAIEKAARAPVPPERPPRAGALALQASSHVVGTRDRGALLAWTTSSPATLAERASAASVGPLLFWRSDGRTLLLVPRALPRPALARAAAALRLRGFEAALAARGHAWVDVAAREGGAPLMPAGAAAGGACAHPWSRPHVDLARRLGQPVPAAGEACGGERARVRLAQIG